MSHEKKPVWMPRTGGAAVSFDPVAGTLSLNFERSAAPRRGASPAAALLAEALGDELRGLVQLAPVPAGRTYTTYGQADGGHGGVIDTEATTLALQQRERVRPYQVAQVLARLQQYVAEEQARPWAPADPRLTRAAAAFQEVLLELAAASQLGFLAMALRGPDPEALAGEVLDLVTR